MLEILKRTKISIGLDIGTHSIKLVGLRHTPRGVFLINTAVKEFPLEARGKEMGVNVIAESIKGLFLEENIKPQKVTIGVSGPQVAIRRISLPSMPKKELQEAVRWEARKFISSPVEEAIVDFQPLGEIVEEGRKKLDLLVVATEGKFIADQVAVIKEAGLVPVGTSTIPHALWHCIQRIPEAREGLSAMIDIGATKTSINIVRDNRIRFSREIVTAGNAFTEAIEEAATLEGAHLDFAEAEKIKEEYGIPKEDDVELAKGHVPLQKISFVMRPVLERLLTEIKRSFEFYKGQFKEEENVGRIFISGGGARLKGLREYLADQLGTEVELLTPFNDMDPTLAIATGLALGRAKEINLLPEAYQLPSPKILVQRYAPVTLAFLVFFLLFGIYLKMNVKCTQYRKELRLKKAQLDGLQSANQRLVRLKEIKRRLDEKRALFPKVALQEPLWGEILKEISHIIPKKVVLTGLFFQTKEMVKELRLEGVTFGGDAETVTSIVDIIEDLDKSTFFSDVWLSSSEENNEYSKSGATFEIVCKIVP